LPFDIIGKPRRHSSLPSFAGPLTLCPPYHSYSRNARETPRFSTSGSCPPLPPPDQTSKITPYGPLDPGIHHLSRQSFQGRLCRASVACLPPHAWHSVKLRKYRQSPVAGRVSNGLSPRPERFLMDGAEAGVSSGPERTSRVREDQDTPRRPRQAQKDPGRVPPTLQVVGTYPTLPPAP
jgi:hypothetical protein